MLNHPQYTMQHVQDTQLQRNEIARMQQLIFDTELHLRHLNDNVMYLGRNIRTQEESIRYASLLVELNQTKDYLNSHYQALNNMIQMANLNFSKTIPEQCRREIYHLYHAGRYTQTQLASQYNVSQSAVNKIVNGAAPLPIEGVNPNGNLLNICNVCLRHKGDFMVAIELLEQHITELDDDSFSKLREWFKEFEQIRWDKKIESDSNAGKLDFLIDAALAEHQAGKTKLL